MDNPKPRTKGNHTQITHVLFWHACPKLKLAQIKGRKFRLALFVWIDRDPAVCFPHNRNFLDATQEKTLAINKNRTPSLQG